MKFKNVAGVAACSVLIAALVIPSHAAMKNITINDGRYSGSGWWGNHEDNEVEPNNITNQNWDFEGFFSDGKTLTVVGGFNFKNGYGGEYSGDVFVDINGGTPNKNGLNPSVYDYVINFDRTTTGKLTGNYVIKKLEGNYTLAPCMYAQNAGSNPWKLLSGGTVVGTGTASFDVANGKNSTDYVDVFGTKLFHDKYSRKHYMINDINLSFLSKINNPSGIMNVTFYSTMSCGNDKLFGKTPINVPEPGTLSLLASGLLVFFGYNRFQRRKSISF